MFVKYMEGSITEKGVRYKRRNKEQKKENMGMSEKKK